MKIKSLATIAVVSLAVCVAYDRVKGGKTGPFAVKP